MSAKNESSTFWIDNGRVALKFLKNGEGCSIKNLVRRGGEACFSLSPPSQLGTPFWELELRNKRGYKCLLDSLNAGKFSYRIKEEDDGVRAILQWEDAPAVFPDEGRLGDVKIRLDFHLPYDGSLIYCRPNVEVSGSGFTIWKFTFPKFDDVYRVGVDRENDRLLLPNGLGVCIPNPVSNKEELTGTLFGHKLDVYPGGWWTMQFLALDNNGEGIYLGLHDPEGRPKKINLKSSSEERLELSFDHFPENMGQNQSGFDLGFPVVIGLYEGGWYDAAQIYRSWALKKATWTKNGTVIEREDIPQWLKETSLWWMPRLPVESCRERETGGFAELQRSFGGKEIRKTCLLLKRLKERFPVRTGVHWYNWHQIPFDTCYPDYFPFRPGFKEAIEELQKEGLNIMPYINARLADPNSRAWKENNLHKAAAKRASARFDPETLSRYYEDYGSEQYMCPMCPSTEVWRGKIKDLVKRLRNELNVQAVYLDQIAAGPPPICFDPDHGHPLGGGSYGVKAYQELLKDLVEWKEKSNSSLALTTECNSEPFMGWISAYLVWHSARANQVPLFPTVYGDYYLAFGRLFLKRDLEDSNVFISKIAQMFNYGIQLGWISEEVAEGLLDEHKEAAEYLLRTAKVFQEAWRYLAAGQRLKDPEPLSEIPTVRVDWDMDLFGKWRCDIPIVMAALWKNPEEDKIGVSLTNWGEETRAVVWKIGSSQLEPLSTDDYQVQKLAGEGGKVDYWTDKDAILLETVLEPYSSKVLEIKSKSHKEFTS